MTGPARNGPDAAKNRRKRAGDDGAAARRAARPRAHARSRCWCCCTTPSSTTPGSATATKCAGSASIWSCCSTTVSSWPSCSSFPDCSCGTVWRAKGLGAFCGDRAWRLGVPFLLSIFVLMPIAYYPTFLRYHLPGTTDFNFLISGWRTITVGPWPSVAEPGFSGCCSRFDAIAAALSGSSMPRAIADASASDRACVRTGPVAAFVGFLVVSIAVYLPLRADGRRRSWLEPWGYPLPIQTSRILLYTGVFLRRLRLSARVGLRSRPARREDGQLAHDCWVLWLGLAPLVLCRRFSLLVYHQTSRADRSRQRRRAWFDISYGLAFAIFSAAHGVRRCRRSVLALRQIRLAPARCAAAVGLRHLSPALYFHHLAAIRRVRLFIASLRQSLRSSSSARCR